MEYTHTNELDFALELEQLGKFKGRLEAARLNRNDFNHSLFEYEFDQVVREVSDAIDDVIWELDIRRSQLLAELGIVPMYEEGLPV